MYLDNHSAGPEGADNGGSHNEPPEGGWGCWFWNENEPGHCGRSLAVISEGNEEYDGDERDQGNSLGGAVNNHAPPNHNNNNGPCSAFTRPSVMSRVYMVMDEYRLTLQLLFLILGTGVLWVCANHCLPCIFVLMIVSCFFCLEYRLVNLLLWACIVVLWMHGWTFSSSSGNGLHASMGWD